MPGPWRLLLVGGAPGVVGGASEVVGGASEVVCRAPGVVGGASEVEGCPAGLVGKASSGRCSSGVVGGGGTVEETSDNPQYTMWGVRSMNHIGSNEIFEP